MKIALSVGIEFAAAVFLGAFAGYEIDVMFRTAPIGLIIGFALGGAVGFWNIYKLVKKLDERN